jgi:hypothetical protein
MSALSTLKDLGIQPAAPLPDPPPAVSVPLHQRLAEQLREAQRKAGTAVLTLVEKRSAVLAAVAALNAASLALQQSTAEALTVAADVNGTLRSITVGEADPRYPWTVGDDGTLTFHPAIQD